MRPSSFLLWVVRGVFVLCSLGVATGLALQGAERTDIAVTGTYGIAVPIGLFALVIFAVVGIILLDVRTKNKQITTISAIYFGLLLGLLFGHLFTSAILPIMDADPLGKSNASWYA